MPTPQELFKQAETLRKEGKNPEAIGVLAELLALDDSHVLAHMTIARLYGKLGKHAEAIQHSVRACQLEPKESFNFAALSQAYQQAFEATQDRAYILKAEEAKAISHQLMYQQ